MRQTIVRDEQGRRLCDEEDCTEPAWTLGRCRPHAMVPLGQEDPEDRRDDPGGDD